MFRPATAVLLGLALLAPATALTQSTLPPAAVLNTVYRFETVDSFELQGSPESAIYSGYRSYVTVTGTLQGQSTPTTLRFAYSLSVPSTSSDATRTHERCERFALLAMNKPGQYLLELRQENNFGNHLGCKLTRL